MKGKLVFNLCCLVELGCIASLAGIGLKRNNDCYKAEIKLVDAKIELFKTQVDNIYKDAEIKRLKKELAELKNEEVEEL